MDSPVATKQMRSGLDMGDESLAAIHRCDRQRAEKTVVVSAMEPHPPTSTRRLPEGFEDIMLINQMMTRPMKNADG
jgi:hypothetical protein